MPTATFIESANVAPRATTKRRATWVAAVVFVLGLSTIHTLYSDGWIGHYSYLAATVGASAVAWIAAIQRGGATRRWLAIGISASALGDVLYQLYFELNLIEPDVSMADAAWIASYIGVGIAMLLLLRKGHERLRTAVDGLIDMAVIALVACLLLWEFWLQGTFTDESVPLSIRFVWAAYPILDAVLLGLVVRTLIERRTQTRTGVLLALGVTCWLISDFYFFIIVSPSELIANLLDIGWMLGAALLAGACWFDDRNPSTNEVDAGHDTVGKWRIALAVAPLLVPSVIELIAYVEGTDAHPIPLLAATVAFAGLAAARALRLLHMRDRAQLHLVASEHLYRALAANSSDAVLMLDADGVIMNQAPALASLVGHPGEDTVGHRALDFVAATDDATQNLFNEALLSPGVVMAGESLIRRPDDSELWLSTRAVNLLDDPDVRGIVVNVHDITARKQSENDLLHQAFHDSLTGLANRALFHDSVGHALSRRGRSGFDPAVIYVELDGFKNVNDVLGHEAGDAVLKEVADRLRAIVRPGDTVARLGGDEFAILVEESGRVQVEAESIADRTLQALAAPIALGDRDVKLSASIGIALGDSLATASTLLRDADVAMYQAKTTGKARWVLFEWAMRATAVKRSQLENDMARMIEGEQLSLVYQPVVELQTNRIVGFEALVRWEHPVLGTIMPDQFIPLAENNGMITAIGKWVLFIACRTAAGWRDRHAGALTIGVNLSAQQLAEPELLDDVKDALRAAGLDPQDLVLEMTETALVQDPALAATKLHHLRALGVRLAIDDFGTGYSSLSYLRQFPVDILKIDRSFIELIVDREHVPPIVRGLLELARTLQLKTVAEGIESAAQLAQLRDEQCELGQGFLFARPLRAEEAERLLETFLPFAWQTPEALFTS
mgnify:CR=1 FL=1